MARMTIGELARRAGVGVETVRYYQRRGLLPEPARRPRSTREYSQEALELLRFIRRARGLGFTVREIEKLLALRSSRKDASELAGILRAKMRELETEVREKRAVIRTLEEMAESCETTADPWRTFDVEG